MRNTIQFQKDLKKQAVQIVERSKTSNTINHQVNVHNKHLNTSISSLLKRVQLQKGLPYSNSQIVQTKRSGIPQSIVTLDKICQMMGFQAMGQIKQYPGFDYLARRTQRNQNGDTYNQTFDFKNQMFIQSPDLQKNMIFFAGRTIDSWNKFVKDQGQMKVYFQKIASLKNSQQYVNQIARSSSVGTIRYKILATLYYFYVDCSQDILSLSSQYRQELVKLLLSKGKLTKVWTQIKSMIDESQTQASNYMFNLEDSIKKSFKTVLTPDQFIKVQPFLMRQNAYLTLDYLNIPNQFKQKRWTQEITNQKIQNIVQVQDWDAKSMYFKSGNFLFI